MGAGALVRSNTGKYISFYGRLKNILVGKYFSVYQPLADGEKKFNFGPCS